MLKIAKSLIVIAAVAALAVGATSAYFSDSVTSNGNSFTAGTLELNVDGAHTNVVKYNVANMAPGSQRIGTWRLKNVGTINGYIDLHSILVTSQENSCNAAEIAAGDTTCNNPGVGEGELQTLLSLSKMFWDNDCDGWVDAGETTIYDGKVGSIGTDYDLNVALNAGVEKCVTGQFNWWSNGANDNLGQGDSMTLDMAFELAQTTGQ